VAVALDADIVVRSTRGERRIPARDFYLGPLTTSLEPDELLVAAEWPRAPAQTGAAIEELTYRHGDYAVVGVVSQISHGQDDQVADVRIALFGVDGTPVRATAAERMLTDGGIAALPDAAESAAAACDPASDVTASASYRRRMVAVFTRRAVQAAFRGAGRSTVETTREEG
jgi:CO/xanthine dehydrogenase FAD-binding subunit